VDYTTLRRDVMRIEVTGDDVRDGIKGSCIYCPIARALRRCLDVEDPYGVQVNREFVVISGSPAVADGRYVRPGVHDLPASASQFVQSFDAGAAVEPFSFDFDLSGEGGGR
jgi:hypothetical protein